MDEKDLDRLFATFLPALLGRSEDASRLVLNPIAVDEDIVVFGVDLANGSWGCALINYVDVHASARLRLAREVWAFHPSNRRFHARAAAYCVRLEEGDEIVCAWGNARTWWTWTGGALHEEKLF